ncbi:MAG TPA: carboxypeptidase-like regulatory domain-containing protein [Saprospiraceae bacterium]|nr:carboxypeptidase-like regulatory domain-containing protein [Saprospiraceae bacterium]
MRIFGYTNHFTVMRAACMIFSVCFFILSAIPVSAQKTEVLLQGQVLDASDQSPLEFAQLYIPQTPYHAETDAKGRFTLRVTLAAEWQLQCSRLGYQTRSLKLSESDLLLNKPILIHLVKTISEEIEIRDKSDNQESGVREKASSFEMLPNLSGNLESLLPSIALGLRSSAGGELSSQYSVRGGSYDENLVYVNDFEVFRPQLIRNGQQEGLSFPNPDLIRDLKFSSGGFEARYGDKLSSVLDIHYKVPDSFATGFHLSPLGLAAHVEGSAFAKADGAHRLRYLAGARYKSTRYLLSSLDLEGEYQPDFLDLQSYLSWDLNPDWKLAWIGNINTSRYSLIPESASTAKGSFFQLLQLNTAFDGTEKDLFRQYMSGISLSFLPLKSRIPYFIKFITSFHRGAEAEQFDILGYYRLVELEVGNEDEEGREVQLWGVGTQHSYARNYLDSWVWHQELQGGWALESEDRPVNHWFQWGLFTRQEYLDDRINEWERLDSAGFSLPYVEDALVLNYVYKTANTVRNFKSGAWFQDELQFAKTSKGLWKLTPGLRLHYSDLNGEWLFNPRLKLEWSGIRHPKQPHYWLSGGWYHQPPFYRELRDPEGRLNPELLAQKSFHAVAGLQRSFMMSRVSPSKFKWISEIYYKKLWDLVSYELENVRIRYSAKNDSEGYAVGWDNRINGEFVPGVESWVNLSFLRTREKLEGVDHRKRDPSEPEGVSVKDVPRPTDQFFALGMFFQDYLPRNERVKMHLQIHVASGLPYGLKGSNTIFRNDSRLKPYHRVDIGFSYGLWERNSAAFSSRSVFRFCRKAWLSAEVYNLLKVKNEASVSWIKSLYNYQFAIPNYLSSRRINLKLAIDF